MEEQKKHKTLHERWAEDCKKPMGGSGFNKFVDKNDCSDSPKVKSTKGVKPKMHPANVKKG